MMPIHKIKFNNSKNHFNLDPHNVFNRGDNDQRGTAHAGKELAR
jgi:hypothetical protein